MRVNVQCVRRRNDETRLLTLIGIPVQCKPKGKRQWRPFNRWYPIANYKRRFIRQLTHRRSFSSWRDTWYDQRNVPHTLTGRTCDRDAVCRSCTDKEKSPSTCSYCEEEKKNRRQNIIRYTHKSKCTLRALNPFVLVERLIPGLGST